MAIIRKISPTDTIVFGTADADIIEVSSPDSPGQSVFGGLGNDIYYIDAFFNGDPDPDKAADVIYEDANGGVDTVNLSLYGYGVYGNSAYTLGANLENLNVTGSTATGQPNTFSLNGNDAANIITTFAFVSSQPNEAVQFNISGFGGNDKLSGSTFRDTLDGGVGNDTMIGGAGNDYYIVDSTKDVITELASDNAFADTVSSSTTYTLGANVEDMNLTGFANINATGNALANMLNGNIGNNLISGLAGNDYLWGGNGNDTLLGGIGNDSLDGSAGIDKLDGGAGDDVYIDVQAADIVTDSGVGGNDIVNASEQLIGDLGAGIETLNIAGTAISGRGNALSNVINANGLNNIIFGLAGNDLLNGFAGEDVLNGGDGADVLDGGAGSDIMRGGNGNDIYLFDDVGDIAIEDTAVITTGGVDTIFSSVTIGNLGANIENVRFTGSASVGITNGNASNNLIIGNSGNNAIDSGTGDDTIDGGAGSDFMVGRAGKNVYIVDNINDTIMDYGNPGEIDTVRISASGFSVFDLQIIESFSDSIENVEILAGGNHDVFGNYNNNTITGNEGENYLHGRLGNDTIFGGLGADRLYGEGGNDKLVGGGGNDEYYLTVAGEDVVVEKANEGNDTVNVSFSVDLSLAAFANIEHIYFTGITGGVTGKGNAFNNSISSAVTNFNLTVDGGAGNDYIQGSSGDDSLIGGLGNDTLNGATGNNTLNGGAGNDTYYYNGDTIIDTTGIDIVYASVDRNLDLSVAQQFTNIENGTLYYSYSGYAYVPVRGKDITGNTLANLLTGNHDDNVLTGGDGADTLIGGTGDDTLNGGSGNDVYYYEDSEDDHLLIDGSGIDTIISSGSVNLGDAKLTGKNIENVTLIGYGNVNALAEYEAGVSNILIGNAGNNSLNAGDGNDTLKGGAGNDILVGGGGVDSMDGGVGHDTYYVDNVNDKVIELPNEGIDTVHSSISFNLALKGVYIENLILDYSDSPTILSATGNKLDNYISGNTANNIIDGGAGNDVLWGNGGSDTMTGGLGEDSFAFTDLDFDVDTVKDFTQGTDNILLTFDGLTFNGAGGSLSAANFAFGTVATTADQHILYDQATGSLYYDYDGVGGFGVSEWIADFKDGLALTSADFFEFEPF